MDLDEPYDATLKEGTPTESEDSSIVGYVLILGLSSTSQLSINNADKQISGNS